MIFYICNLMFFNIVFILTTLVSLGLIIAQMLIIHDWWGTRKYIPFTQWLWCCLFEDYEWYGILVTCGGYSLLHMITFFPEMFKFLI